MPRSFPLALLTIAYSTLLVSSTVGAKEPDYPCYMTTRTGRVLNLGSLCGDRTAPAVAVQSSQKSSKSRQKAVIEFTGLRVDRDEAGKWHGSGQITNLSNNVIVVSSIHGVGQNGVAVEIDFLDQIVEPGDTFAFQDAYADAIVDTSGALKDVIYWTDGAGKHYDGFTVCSAVASVGCKTR